MKRMIWFIGLFCLVAASSSLAGWYAGADAAYVEQDFEPTYVVPSDPANPPSSYNDHGYGMGEGLFGGYRWPLHELLALSAQGRAEYSDAEWTYTYSAEPASFKYDIKYALGLSLVPEIKVIGPLSIVGEVGLQEGYIREEKTSATYTSYDFGDWILGMVLSAGLKCEVTKNLSVSAMFRHVSYNDVNYTTHLADGTVVEYVTDAPENASWNLGVEWKF